MHATQSFASGWCRFHLMYGIGVNQMELAIDARILLIVARVVLRETLVFTKFQG
jgi:hypothetical protein